MTMKLSAAETTKLRFRIGARVECNLGSALGWLPGSVAQHFYQQDTFPAGTCMPYQIALDDGRLIFARRDHEDDIRALLNEPAPKLSVMPRPENRAALLYSFLRTFAYIGYSWAAMQAGEYYKTGSVSFTMTFADVELVNMNGTLSFEGFGVAALAAAILVAGQMVLSPSSCGWLERDGVRTRAGKADYASIVLLCTTVPIGEELLFRGALPTLAANLLPHNPNATAAGLIASVVLYQLLHPAQHAFFAAFAGFWFAIAGYYGGVQAAVVASLLAQLASSLIFFALFEGKHVIEPPAPLFHAGGAGGEPATGGGGGGDDERAPPVTQPKSSEAPAEEADDADDDAWAPIPMLDPCLPYPKNRTMVLRSLRGNSVCVVASCLLLQAAEYFITGRPRLSFDSVPIELISGSWLQMVGTGMAACASVVFGMDIFSARGNSGVLADSATCWLNGGRIAAKGGKPDRAAILLNALFTAIGHETLFRGALPSLACKLVNAKLLPPPPPGHDPLAYGLVVSMGAYFIFHPARYAYFAAFASFWYAIAAYCGGLGAAVLASAASQVGASSLYFYAVLREKGMMRSAAGGQTKGKAKEGPMQLGVGVAGSKALANGNAKKSSKKQR